MADNLHLDNSLFFQTSAAGFQPGDFVLHRMEGRESISTPYEFELEFACRIDGGISPDSADALLDATAQISFGPAGLQRVSGVLRELERLTIHPKGTVSSYRAVLVPRFWLSTLSRRSRVFNEMTIPAVLEEILGEMLIDFELRLTETYAEREYIVQYEETDFAFMSRWMERLGIYYYFEQGESAETLVITDSASMLVDVTDHVACPYTNSDRPVSGCVHGVRRRHRKLPQNQYVGDFNWRTPGRRISGEHPIDDAFGTGLVSHYGDHFKDDGEGARMAQVRAEALAVDKTVFQMWTINPDFAPGYRFSIADSPMGELDMEYTILSVTHEASQEGDGVGRGLYKNDVTAIAHAVPYRAPRLTPWPRIDGVMHARIDAASVSSASPVDDQGRYRVVIPYDLNGEFGGRATRWIRKAEPYSGPSYGMHFTLHVGCEVLLAHTGGDPDRPVIVGSVPNPATSSPLNSANATRSAIRTRSGIMFDFEDDARVPGDFDHG